MFCLICFSLFLVCFDFFFNLLGSFDHFSFYFASFIGKRLVINWLGCDNRSEVTFSMA